MQKKKPGVWGIGRWGASKNHKNTVTKTKLTHVNVTDC